MLWFWSRKQLFYSVRWKDCLYLVLNITLSSKVLENESSSVCSLTAKSGGDFCVCSKVQTWTSMTGKWDLRGCSGRKFKFGKKILSLMKAFDIYEYCMFSIMLNLFYFGRKLSFLHILTWNERYNLEPMKALILHFLCVYLCLFVYINNVVYFLYCLLGSLFYSPIN